MSPVTAVIACVRAAEQRAAAQASTDASGSRPGSTLLLADRAKIGGGSHGHGSARRVPGSGVQGLAGIEPPFQSRGCPWEDTKLLAKLLLSRIDDLVAGRWDAASELPPPAPSW